MVIFFEGTLKKEIDVSKELLFNDWFYFHNKTFFPY